MSASPTREPTPETPPETPPDLPKDPRRWNREQLKRFFKANQDEYGLEDDDIELIYKNNVRGRHLPKLTEEKLCNHPYNLSGGGAATVIDLISEVIKPQQQMNTQYWAEKNEDNIELPNKRVRLELDYRHLGYSSIEELCDRLTEPFPEFAHCPSVDDLDDMLRTPLSVSLPYASDVDPNILASHPYLIPRHFLALSTFKDISGLLGAILLPRGIFLSGNQNEDSFHVIWDTIIRETLTLFSSNIFLEFQRNGRDVHGSGTTTAQTRPDFLCWMDQALVFRGEEKSSPEMLPIARTELEVKFGEWTPLFYGQLPFVFAYATGGCMIQFYRIMPDGQCQTLSHNIFNASLPSNRLSIFRTTINILRCLKTLKRLIPSDRPLRLFYEYRRPKDVTLTIAPSTVLKRIPSLAVSEELRNLYEMIWLQRPKHIINLAKQPRYGRTITSLHLCPVGFHPRLRNISELRHAVKGILKGLDWLHQYDYVHRDLRWANVIQDMEGNVRLIDLEYAGKEGVVEYGNILRHWPIMEGEIYLKGIDVYSVAKMMGEYSSLLGGENSREGYTFMTRLERGISTKDALKDCWFLD
ncbi:hypothetical protein L211DRAFT_840185 [Terfezia boudieri ATCC MYA-4762]|uniref:Protein kinase domain-containing protein n=1 Tax=Terfezia boudieri ATCC MYA-4762 TaxID=1051890 RepID=A0A3N4LKA1_9PEZI|nr:hypothetical protein L211DRAFT_840185 [Terfezia boudieri ATCC MYA-4762]